MKQLIVRDEKGGFLATLLWNVTLWNSSPCRKLIVLIPSEELDLNVSKLLCLLKSCRVSIFLKIVVYLDNQIILLITQRLSVNQNVVTSNSGRRQERAPNLIGNGHARGVTRIMKVRSDNKQDGDANEDDDKLFHSAR